MAFSINRIVLQENLLKRPRVSYRISEYVFDYINNQILKPANVLQSDKYTYTFTLSFSLGIPLNHKIVYQSPYKTDKRLFVPHKGFTTFEKTIKVAHLTVVADDIDENMQPREYALLVYDMFADYLVYNYSSLKKDLFDIAVKHLNISVVDSYKYPAPFQEQKYVMDEGKYLSDTGQWRTSKEDYLNRYDF